MSTQIGIILKSQLIFFCEKCRFKAGDLVNIFIIFVKNKENFKKCTKKVDF